MRYPTHVSTLSLLLFFIYLQYLICADFPKYMAYIASHNRMVNMYGKPGRGKPVDEVIEQYNL